MDEKEKRHLFDNPRNVTRAIRVLYGVCALSLGVEFFVDRHVDHPWEAMFGFYSLYGLVACVILVLLAKEMRKVLMRKEDHYDGESDGG